MERKIFLAGLILFTAINLEAGKIELKEGCYKLSYPFDKKACTQQYIKKVLIDGKKQTSAHVAVARWWGIPKVEIIFNLENYYKINGIKLYTTIGKDQRIRTVTVLSSLDGAHYKEIIKKENEKHSITYPEPQIIEIKFKPSLSRYIKLILEKDPKYPGFQLSEVEIYCEGKSEREKIKGKITNLLKNPGFEEGMVNWEIKKISGHPDVYLSEESHSGRKSIVIENKGGVDFAIVSQSFPVVPGENYTLVFWYRMEKEKGGSAEVSFLQKKGEKNIYLPQTTKWTKWQIRKNSGNLVSGTVSFILWHRNNKIWIDDVSIYGPLYKTTSQKFTTKISLPNPGFEEDKNKDNIPDGWTPQIFENQGNPVMSYEDGRNSKKSVAIYTPDETSAGCWSTTISVKPHTYYKLSFWYKTSGQGCPEILFFGDRYIPPTSHNRWEKGVIWGNSGTSDKLNLTLLLYHRPEQKVWFDDLEISEIPPDSAEFYYYKEDAYVSKDMPVIFALGSRNFGIKTPLKLIFEVPEGIKLEGVWVSDSLESGKFDLRKIKRGGENYYHYIIEIPYVWTYPEMVHIFLTTNWKEGRKGRGYFWAEWGGGKQKEEAVTFHSIRIPRARILKKIYAGFNLYGEVLGYIWPDFFTNFQRLGLNMLHLSSKEFVNPRSELLDRFIREAKRRGITVVCDYAPFVNTKGIKNSDTASAGTFLHQSI